MKTSIEVNGLPLPPHLAQLLLEDRWRGLDQKKLLAIAPWFQGPIELVHSIEWMETESVRSVADLAGADHFMELAGSLNPSDNDLPWLDVEKSVMIGVNEIPGDDLGIALDYRAGATTPRIVGSYWEETPFRCSWRPISDSFEAFAKAIGS